MIETELKSISISIHHSYLRCLIDESTQIVTLGQHTLKPGSAVVITNAEALLLNIMGHEAQYWSFLDRDGTWSRHGKLPLCVLNQCNMESRKTNAYLQQQPACLHQAPLH